MTIQTGQVDISIDMGGVIDKRMNMVTWKRYETSIDFECSSLSITLVFDNNDGKPYLQLNNILLSNALQRDVRILQVLKAIALSYDKLVEVGEYENMIARSIDVNRLQEFVTTNNNMLRAYNNPFLLQRYKHLIENTLDLNRY